MEPGIVYCTAYPEDSSFGALHDAFSYRLTGSSIANPEYDPGGMRKAFYTRSPKLKRYTRPRLVHKHNDTLPGGHGASRLGGYPLVLRGDT